MDYDEYLCYLCTQAASVDQNISEFQDEPEDFEEEGSIIVEPPKKNFDKFRVGDYDYHRTRALAAIWDSETWFEDRERDAEQTDLRESYSSKDGKSDYAVSVKVNCLWKGNIKTERKWFPHNAHVVDGTTRTSCYVYPPHCTSSLDSEWYQLGKDKYKKVTIQLSPHSKSREYGRVFFSTATKYVSEDAIVYPRIKPHEVKGYIRRNGRKVYCKKYKNVLKGTLFEDSGSNILKKPTFKGKLIERLFWNLEVERTENYYQSGDFVNKNFFRLKNFYNYNIEDWVLDLTRQYPYEYKIGREAHKDSYLSKYRKGGTFDNDIFESQVEGLYYSSYCKKIQRVWKPKYNRRLRAGIIIARSWSAYRLQRMGDRFTVTEDDH
jgi:hypothetical protein